MVQHIRDLKADMATGKSSCLMEVVKKMHVEMQFKRIEFEEARIELEKARNEARLAEQRRIEAMISLRKSEETVKKLKSEVSKKQGEKQAKENSIMWELLRQKRKSLLDTSPLGPNELLGLATSSKKPLSNRVILSLTYSARPPKRSKFSHPDLQISSIHSEMLLGSSPSATTQKVWGKHKTL